MKMRGRGLRGVRWWRRVWLSVGLGGAVFLLLMAVLVGRAGPILRGRVVEALSARFNSRVELDDLQVHVATGLDVEGKGLRIFAPDDVVAAGAKEPLIAVRQFDFRAGLLGLLIKPTRVGRVHVSGLAIHIPPKAMRRQGAGGRHMGKMKIRVEEIDCDDSELVIGTDKPDKDPKVFHLQHIVLHEVGPKAPWQFHAVLTNAVPKGNIDAEGTFGPWSTEAPGDSGVAGRYVFDHADLNTIKGIGGMLHSTGSFDGRLDRIAVRGTTEVPNFSLDTANHPVPLWTRFNAIVDGTSGDTYLQPVEAKLGQSQFVCRGAVVNVKGRGHLIDLQVDVPAGRIEDFLALSVKTEPAVMTGVIATKARLRIPPGKESVSQKMSMQGKFALQQIHFTNAGIEDKVDGMSLRAQGKPGKAMPGAPDVQSRMTGEFAMGEGELRFRQLNYTLPGAEVRLNGVYSMDGSKFEFLGKVRTEAKLSQMIASGWKSWLLKPVDPFFHKDGAGAEIPVKISGVNGKPHFGLHFGGDTVK